MRSLRASDQSLRSDEMKYAVTLAASQNVQIFIALNGCRALFAGGSASRPKSRWAVGKKVKPKGTQVLEYLLDYSISNFAIPQAIAQTKQNAPKLLASERYHLLLTVESELGDNNEVARDFLKLLDVRSRFRCLIFARRRKTNQSALNTQLQWVISHHGSFDPDIPILFIAIPRYPQANFIDKIQFFHIVNRQVVSLSEC
jgi:hypothetical protein